MKHKPLPINIRSVPKIKVLRAADRQPIIYATPVSEPTSSDSLKAFKRELKQVVAKKLVQQ